MLFGNLFVFDYQGPTMVGVGTICCDVDCVAALEIQESFGSTIGGGFPGGNVSGVLWIPNDEYLDKREYSG
jgi:hypothetical protein